MTTQELIKGMYAIRAMIESHKDTFPMQTENQINVIDEVIERLYDSGGRRDVMNNEVKYYKVAHADGTNTFYDADGKEIAEPKDANLENVKVLHDMELTE